MNQESESGLNKEFTTAKKKNKALEGLPSTTTFGTGGALQQAQPAASTESQRDAEDSPSKEG